MSRHKGIIAGIVLFMLIGGIYYWYMQRVVVLHLGIFAGSSWDVPNGDSYRIIDDAINRFEQEHPGVKIEYDSGILREDYSSWLAGKFLKGEEPDVFIVLGEDFNTLSSLGALKDLSYVIKHDENFAADDYYPSALDSGKYQNKQYALPYESNPTLMFVNKTLLEKEGIAMPSNDWTLDDFYAICRAVTKDTDGDGIIDQYGCYNYTWLDSVYSHDIKLFNEQGTECFVDESAMKDAIMFVQRLNALDGGHTITAAEFDRGKVAFAPLPFSQYRTYKPYPWRVKKYSNFEWDCVKMPSVAAGKNTSEVSTVMMAISSRTLHSETAWEFLKMLTYDEYIQKEIFQYSQGISSLKSVMTSKDTLSLLENDVLGDSEVDMSLLNEVMMSTKSHSQFRKYESALSLIDMRIKQIMDDTNDLDISLINLQKEVNKYLNE